MPLLLTKKDVMAVLEMKDCIDVVEKAFLELELQIAEKQASTSKERDVLFEKFTQITDNLPYEEYRKPIVQHTFRNIVNRSFTNKEEIHAMIGVFRTIFNQLFTQE